MPYSEDEAKRERYVYFLTLRAGQADNLPDRPKGMGTDEWAKELREFAQAAEVFKPISGLMASRFTSSTSASGGPRLASDAPDPEPLRREKEEDPAEKAAKMGMYGPLTRSRQQFYPTRLLCKRFNVRAPAHVDPSGALGTHADMAEPGSSRTQEVVSQASLDRMMREASFGGKPGFVSGGLEGGENEIGARSVKVQPERIDVEKNEALEGQKAGEAVFKAIFGSDDEDD